MIREIRRKQKRTFHAMSTSFFYTYTHFRNFLLPSQELLQLGTYENSYKKVFIDMFAIASAAVCVGQIKYKSESNAMSACVGLV